MNPREGATVGQLVVEWKHAVRRQRARIALVEVGVHDAVVIHRGAQQVGTTWQGAGSLLVEGLRVARRGLAGVSQVFAAVGPQTFHGGEEVQPSRKPRGHVEMTGDLEGVS